MGLLGRLAQALAFLPALGLFRLGEVGLVGALGGFRGGVRGFSLS